MLEIYTHILICTHTAPTAPPSNFHVVVINKTAIEVQWSLPPFINRGGIIQGYKLFYENANGGGEMVIGITDNTTDVYIVSGLTPNTLYRFSVLAYTSVGSGPRSIKLAISTLSKILNMPKLVWQCVQYHVYNYDFL